MSPAPSTCIERTASADRPMPVRIERYWGERAVSYSDQVISQANSPEAQAYLDIIDSCFDGGCRGKRVLDIGCGPGFFARLLSGRGCDYIGIDCTNEMLDQARRGTGHLPDSIAFERGDAQSLSFAPDTFDLVVSRYVTWNLPRPEQAYSEWKRVLKPGGFLVNFDANWYTHLFNEEDRRAYEDDRANAFRAEVRDPYAFTDVNEMESIASRLPLSQAKRPLWDSVVLLEQGFAALRIDRDFWTRGWTEEEKLVDASAPAFAVVARK